MHDVQWQIPALLPALGKSQLHILLFLHTLTFPLVSRMIFVLSGCWLYIESCTWEMQWGLQSKVLSLEALEIGGGFVNLQWEAGKAGQGQELMETSLLWSTVGGCSNADVFFSSVTILTQPLKDMELPAVLSHLGMSCQQQADEFTLEGAGRSCECTPWEHKVKAFTGGFQQEKLSKAHSGAAACRIHSAYTHTLLLLWGSAPKISWAWQQFPDPPHPAAGLRDALGGRPGSISKLHYPWLWSSLQNYSAWRCITQVLAVANCVKLCGTCTGFCNLWIFTQMLLSQPSWCSCSIQLLEVAVSSLTF